MKPFEASEIAIARDELATGLNRKRGRESVGHEISSHLCSPTQVDKDAPMSSAGREDIAVGLSADCFCELERSFERLFYD